MNLVYYVSMLLAIDCCKKRCCLGALFRLKQSIILFSVLSRNFLGPELVTNIIKWYFIFHCIKFRLFVLNALNATLIDFLRNWRNVNLAFFLNLSYIATCTYIVCKRTSKSKCRLHSAGTWRCFDVTPTSSHCRRCDVNMSHWHHYDVISVPCVRWDMRFEDLYTLTKLQISFKQSGRGFQYLFRYLYSIIY